MLGYRRFSDSQLVDEIKSGNEDALLSMYKQYFTMVKSFILKNNGTEDEIEDVFQDSLIAVWRNVNKKDFTLTVKMSTYLMAIVKNLWFKQLKKKTRFTVVDESLQEKILADDVKTDHLDHSLIHDMVAELDETCKKLLGYFYFDGLENKVIAEKMGFANTDTVKSKKYQCFKKLETAVKDKYSKEDFFR
ncbi:MAG: RNA polymerase sigma factor [Flavobacteriales bacterium]|nr:RNA polymerase sigma factor [Bacteroidota bacterium]MCB9240540.1 RNA polymerase sigma factor [Flavobacteriales bacterium]